MRNTMLALAAVVVALLLGGCAMNNEIMVNPDLASNDYSQRSLALYPTNGSDIQVDNPKDVRDDFPDDDRSPEKIVSILLFGRGYSFLETSLTGIGFQEKICNKTYSLSESPTKFNSIVLESYDQMKNVEMVEYFYPTEEALEEAGLTADVVMYVSNLRTAKEFVSTGQGKQGMLVGYFDFIVWDYQENKPIFWGRDRATEGFVFVCSTKTWDNMATAIFKNSFSKSNFIMK